MKRTHLYQSLLAASLSVAMVFGSLGTAFADQDTAAAEENAVQATTLLEEKLANAKDSGLGTEKLSDSVTDITDLSADEITEIAEAQANIAKLTENADEVVRVSIVVEGEPTTQKFGTADIASNKEALAYRAKLESKQAEVTAAIEAEVLGGETLDVKWNLTLAANVISANVTYGQIPAILKVAGVEKVVVETKYEPAVYSTDSADPNMATSTVMIGSGNAWANGYTGAGSRVAIIDTGLDLDHEMVDADAFEFSLLVKAAMNKQKAAEYVESLDLLDEEEIAGVYEQLNAKINSDVTAEDLYNTSKVPYVFNYIDQNTNGGHEQDNQGDHGSHVSGIAAANKYVKNEDGKYVASLSSTYVQGVAPDAQILVMKVFGEGGGAYDSDYMAAIEDAIILGADSVNLSLGSAAPGFSIDFDGDTGYAAEGGNEYGNDYFLDILDSLEDSDTVVSISAGNAYDWAYYSYYGYLYEEDTVFDTVGSPGSYTNALTVASANNTGSTGRTVTASDGSPIFYTDTQDGYGNAPLTDIVSDTPYTYIAIDGVGTDEEWAALKDVVAGNIAVCSRGTTSFYEKANAAVGNGAVAVFIYNNTSGTISMNLTGYEYDVPVVSLTQSDGTLLKTLGEEKTITVDGTEYTYYEGTVEVTGTVVVQDPDENAVVEMSDFSSYGVPSSLELKPEITAPGGNIYSLMDGNDYQNMSGTSMAAPQVTGMAAVVAQYIKENNLDEKTGLTVRQLSQSLLMATAEPIIDEEWFGYYYPVFRQGAGLANVGNAVSAKAYILMGEDATASASDGKVKVELGDDPDRTGVYTYTFTVNNLSDIEQQYELYTDMFEQVEYPLYSSYGITDNFLTDGAYGMDATAVYEGDAVEDGVVTVPANGSAEVKVTITLSDEEKANIDETYPNGTYLEGYTFITPITNTTSEEGEILGDTVEYSIPILGFYGNWSDASAYDLESFETYYYGAQEKFTDYFDKEPYTLSGFDSLVADYGDQYRYYTNLVELVDPDYAELLIALGLEDYLSQYSYPYLTNPWYVETAENEEGELVATVPDAARKAVTSRDYILDFDTRDIRNSAAFAGIITGEDGEVNLFDLQINHYPVFYYSRYGVWVEMAGDGLYYFGADPAQFGTFVSDLGYEEGDTFTLSAVAIPEYYTKDLDEISEDAVVDIIESDVLGKGAYLSHTFTVDDTAPEFITSYEVDEYENKILDSSECDNASNTLKFTVKDNEYVAVVRVFDFFTDEQIAEFTPAQTEAGEEIQVSVDMSEFPETSIAYIMVGDYAGNYDVALMTYGTYLYIETDGNGTLTASYTVDGEAFEIETPDKEDNLYVLSNLLISEPVDVTFTLKADENYSVDYAEYMKYTDTLDAGDYVEAELEEDSFTITVNPHDMYDVYAGFIGDECTLTVDADNVDLAFDPEPAANDDGTYAVNYGDEYTISAAAGTGVTIEEIDYVNTTTGDAGNIIANADGSYTLTIEGDTTLIVKTSKVNYALTLEGADYVVAESSITLTAALEPELAGDTITWSVSDDSIAEIDENGVLTGKAVAKVTVTATSATGATAEKEVQVLFKDVTDADIDKYWFEPVYWAVENGITTGVAPDYTTFNPTGVTNRGAMVTFLWRMEGEPEPSSTESPFTDVTNPNAYYYKAVLWAAENGIAAGYTDGTFRPSGPCLRRQACMFLWRLAGEPAVDTSEVAFSDIDGIWVEPIVWANQNGIASGYADGTFKPAGECMRRMILTFMYRYANMD
ncbi:MAG: S8 family serine peptidase [Lachnospiraceae bacterium]|nr:S8 family serine peptidase [Lachnospiraceae bacterium]